MRLSKINPEKVKKAIICKNVNSTFLDKQIKKTYIPKAGDVAVFKVKAIGKHTRIESSEGKNKYILPGDFIMGAFGNRYATGQMEGYVPSTYQTTYHILGQGGAIGVLKSIHERYEQVGPTTLSLVGYIVDAYGEVINTKHLSGKALTNKFILLNANVKTIISLGTSMDSGKTTSAAFLARGLKLAGKKVVYFKLTGTVYSKDKKMVRDYGADISIDFSDFGFPSTYMCSTDEILKLYNRLLEQVIPVNPDYIIVEIADGLLQRETHALIHNERFMNGISGVLFSSGDSMSAISGADMLLQLGCNVIGVTGLFTRSPLLIDEVKSKSEHTVLIGEDLMSKEIVNILEPKTNYPSFEKEMVLTS